MENDDFIIKKHKANTGGQGSPRMGFSPRDGLGGSAIKGRHVRAVPRTGRFNARGRGRSALPNIGGYTFLKEGGLHFCSRRVIVKVRVVKMRGTNIAKGSRAAYAHLKYLQRDGTDFERTKDEDGKIVEGESKARLYGPHENDVDAKEFLERGEKSFRGRGDKHQFRIIVSPEDGIELGDLTPFTRDLMRKMEQDLNTRLDWVAVNHYDTAHPHSHIVIRGQTDDGKILNIAGDYISQGIRGRAREMATHYLGMKSSLDIMEDRAREVKQQRYTILDKGLEKISTLSGQVDLRPGMFVKIRTLGGEGINRHVLIGRIKYLRDMGLAHEFKDGQWNLRPELKKTLVALGERGDIIKSIHRAMKRSGIERQAVLHNQPLTKPVIGRVIGKGLAGDEMSGRLRLIVDAVDGQVHAVEVRGNTRAAEAKMGAIVKMEPYTLRPVDKTIFQFSTNNIYSEQKHLHEAVQTLLDRARDHIAVHRRRLKALAAAGVVQEQGEGLWHIPDDFEEKALAYDRNKNRGAKMTLLSQQTLEAQLASDGATWLDKAQVNFDFDSLSGEGFGAETYQAISQRQKWLIKQGFAKRVEGKQIEYQRGYLRKLTEREINKVGAAYSETSGKMFKEHIPEMRVEGVYTKRVELSSGSYAVVESERAFYLVPWRDVMERYKGRHITGRSLSGSISWELRGRSRGIGR
ncbi:MAG: hypothetical protein COA43_04930 [Robiginitomaculum sp.]|nr:MAG: hypothetical protein COA43_04930 [Robiginitomaculum sp.]